MLTLRSVPRHTYPQHLAPQVLVQLPTANTAYPQLEEVAKRLSSRGCEIYRDPSSRNCKAVALAFEENMFQLPPAVSRAHLDSSVAISESPS